MIIRIEATDLPGNRCGPSPDRPAGHPGIHVGLQRRNRPEELIGLTPGDAERATWSCECGDDLRGPYVSGPPGDRFLYLSWVTVEPHATAMFRRAKLLLDAVPDEVLDRARADGVLVGRLGLTDARGNPLCAAVRPPTITWSAALA